MIKIRQRQLDEPHALKTVDVNLNQNIFAVAKLRAFPKQNWDDTTEWNHVKFMYGFTSY